MAWHPVHCAAWHHACVMHSSIIVLPRAHRQKSAWLQACSPCVKITIKLLCVSPTRSGGSYERGSCRAAARPRLSLHVARPLRRPAQPHPWCALHPSCRPRIHPPPILLRGLSVPVMHAAHCMHVCMMKRGKSHDAWLRWGRRCCLGASCALPGNMASQATCALQAWAAGSRAALATSPARGCCCSRPRWRCRWCSTWARPSRTRAPALTALTQPRPPAARWPRRCASRVRGRLPFSLVRFHDM